MRPSVAIPGLILAGALAAACVPAQTPQPPAPVQPVAQATQPVAGAKQSITLRAQPCSVAMRATQGSSSQFLRTRNGNSTPMMRPSLTLTPRDGRKIVSATVTAHGYSPSPGSMDLVARLWPQPKSHSREIAKTLAIRFHAAEDGAFTAELPLPGFSAVTMIDLNSLTYGDGTTWNAPARNECHVAPDPLLLIAAH